MAHLPCHLCRIAGSGLQRGLKGGPRSYVPFSTSFFGQLEVKVVSENKLLVFGIFRCADKGDMEIISQSEGMEGNDFLCWARGAGTFLSRSPGKGVSSGRGPGGHVCVQGHRLVPAPGVSFQVTEETLSSARILLGYSWTYTPELISPLHFLKTLNFSGRRWLMTSREFRVCSPTAHTLSMAATPC